MKIKDSNGERVFSALNVIFMIILMAVTAYPVLYVVMASFSDGNLLMNYTGVLYKPLGFSTKAYEMAFKNSMLLRGYLNTIIIIVAGCSINIILTALGAYALARKNLMFKKEITIFIVFTMYFSGGMIPNYLNVKSLGLDNTLWALILPGAINTFNLIILRTAFMSLPDCLEESALLDGANHFIIMFKIALPLCLPTLAVVFLYYAVAHWNSWFQAMIYIKDRKLYPLQLVLREILLVNGGTSVMETGADRGEKQAVSEVIKYAVIVIATAPILCAYPFVQRFFVKGTMVGAVKG